MNTLMIERAALPSLSSREPAGGMRTAGAGYASELVHMFCAEDSSRDSKVATGHQFLAIAMCGNERALTDRCRVALTDLMRGGYLAVVCDLTAGGRLRRLLRCVFMRSRLARVERALRVGGALSVRRYGVYPSLQSPTVVYELGSPAARYTERNILMETRGFAFRLVGKVLKSMAGYDISLGAAIIIGQRA